MDDVIILIEETTERDQYGRMVPTRTRQQVFCQVENVSQTEFHEAGRNGLKPEFRFVVFAGDYVGEEMCEYHSKTYAIYRTYLRDADTVELYVERKGGTNGKENQAGTATTGNP